MNMPEVNWTYGCRLVRVIDGDTVVMDIDNGFRNREQHAIRLVDVNAPEMFSGDDREHGKRIRQMVIEWFDRQPVTQTFPFIIQTLADRQTFNRYIGTIWSRDTGESLNQFLVDEGYQA